MLGHKVDHLAQALEVSRMLFLQQVAVVVVLDHDRELLALASTADALDQSTARSLLVEHVHLERAGDLVSGLVVRQWKHVGLVGHQLCWQQGRVHWLR